MKKLLPLLFGLVLLTGCVTDVGVGVYNPYPVYYGPSVIVAPYPYYYHGGYYPHRYYFPPIHRPHPIPLVRPHY